MTERSARFALPLLQAGQAQKEIFHNEALTLIDAALHPVAQEVGANTPPDDPAPGECWIVGPSPTGDWDGQANRIAAYTTAGWRYLTPVAGMRAWAIANGRWTLYDGASWAAAPAVAEPAGGGTVDTESRAAITALIAALRAQGVLA